MRKILFVVILFFISVASFAQVIKPFQKVFQKTQRGGIVFLSNVSLSCVSGDTVSLPPSAGSANNNLKSVYIDRDGDPTTFMSSSDSLNLPSCSDITYVGLFWGGNALSSTIGFNSRNTIKIRSNKNPYISITADSSGFFEGSVFKTYYCYKDITSIVKAVGSNARWSVADIVGQDNVTNSFAGWNMVIAYKNESENLRQLTVYSGLSSVLVESVKEDVVVSGFKTPSTGPVTFELGIYTYEGDRGYFGDQLLAKSGKNPSFVNISDKINKSDNIYNSTISRFGELTKFRIPNYNNNFSIDADIFKPDNSLNQFIGNNETTLSLRQTTTQDGYLSQCVTLAIDANIPDNRLGMRVKDLNGGVVLPGDTLEYTLLGSNVGTDHSVDTYITNKIENNAVYVPNSMRISYGPNSGVKSDAINDDQADFDPLTNTIKVRIGRGADGAVGGEVDNSTTGSDSTQVKFKVTVAVKNETDCEKLLCDNIVDNHAYIHGKGKDSGLEFESDQVPQFFDSSTCSVGDISNKTSVIVYTNCPDKSAKLIGATCLGSDVELSGPFVSNGVYEWKGPNNFTSSMRNPKIQNLKSSDSGDYILKMINNDTGCRSYFILQVKVVTPQIANAGVDQKICGFSTSFEGNLPTSSSGKWTLVKGDATSVKIFSEASPTSRVDFTNAGTYEFEWKLAENGCTNIADRVSISVGQCNPSLENEYHLILNDSVATGCVIGSNDKSTDGSKLTVGDVVAPTPPSKTSGTFVLDKSATGSGCYTYTPKPGFVGVDTVVVSVCDALNRCANDTVFVSVLGNQEKSTDKLCSPITGDLTPDDTGLNKQLVLLPRTSYRTKTGVFSIDKFGKYTYVVDCDKAKTTRDTVIVEVCDLLHPTLCIDDTIFININSKPIALPDTYKELNGDLSQNDVNSLDGPNKWFIETQPTEGSVKIDSITGKFVFTPPYPDFQGSVTFTYRIVDKDGDYSIATVNLNIPVLFVPEGFSPNGDGKHDKFVITNIENYPKNTMTILNRWGNKVFDAKPYTNIDAWDGTNQYGLRVGGNILPVGTYFYILDLGNGFKTLKGTIYLSR